MLLGNDDWWRDAVVYQVYPRSFADADGDGTGDLKGVRERLDYLAGLGVDAVWLSPFYTSPLADGGYDVADYRDVDPRFGTLADFDALVAEAHGKGVRVIVDLVPNHSSDQHPWFRAGLRDRYVFRDAPNDWESIFGGPAWTQVEGGQWYLHLFAPEQPDLNWDNPEVRAEFRDILRFWLDRGVDGFRVDVAHGMVKAAGLPDVGAKEGPQAEMLGDEQVPYFDQDGVHDIYREWRPILDSYPGGRMAVAEAWVSSPERLARYIGPDELHQAFNFEFMLADFHAKSFRAVIEKSLAEAELVGAPTTWVLSNHDKPRHVTRHGSLARARAATLLMLALPGSAYLYNGEELGLPEVLDLPDELRQDPAFKRRGESRDGCRVPIPWTAEPGCGWRDPWLPIPPEWTALSAEAQEHDPDSTLNLYRAALRLRKRHPALGGGTLAWLDSPEDVLAIEREPGLVVVLNTGEEPVLPPVAGEVLLSSGPLAADGSIPPDTAAWIQR
ncbi:glycoside hydrolase family 13 protein [Actinomadura sp. ATCC 31491]|uniref:Glycoside hydrolase family 13 protein n=1 Tax=Actinomadura luzonensis TaxID=2805427 RepID=A0ABT0FVX7_9ACTN|nr:glycoside hydrolase family 13 protein [Actinomadura luzonensis]MCK2216058.1 glycoside hydrolase family 13 protein [Actinomadura luzonensis]